MALDQTQGLSEGRIDAYLFGRAIPFWASAAIGANGLAHEEFDFAGQPSETGYRRSMVQFRQIYVFAQAALLGRAPAETASRLFARICDCAWHPAGGWVHRLNPDGSVADPTRDAYDQAFGLFACAWTYALDRREQTLAWAYKTLEHLDRAMAATDGGYVEAIPPRLPRRQNPHMHLLEVFLTLYEVSGDSIFMARADAIVALLERRFVSEEGGLREYFGGAWERADGELADVVEPGHHFEWTWLLYEHARLAGRPPSSYAHTLFQFAVSHGLNAEGLAIEQVDIHGAPKKKSIKLWALAEQLKAQVVVAEHAGAREDHASDRVVSAIFEHFLLPEGVAPLWYEGIDEAQRPDRRRMPMSTLYHLVLSFVEFLRWKGRVPRVLGGPAR
jgi:mannose/cellobiose epimerase-like protein (N-acyl-D-glucosamine 2-epimerase family)